MVYQNSTVPFEKMLMKFVADDDPMQEMLKWLCERLMAAEVDGKLEAQNQSEPKLAKDIGPVIGYGDLIREWGRCI